MMPEIVVFPMNFTFSLPCTVLSIMLGAVGMKTNKGRLVSLKAFQSHRGIRCVFQQTVMDVMRMRNKVLQGSAESGGSQTSS